MPVQLDLLDPKSTATQRASWSQLPAPVRRELIELFATLLTKLVRPTEEDADESRKDSSDTSRS